MMKENGVCGIIINKFRGDMGILEPGIEMLEGEDKQACFRCSPIFHTI